MPTMRRCYDLGVFIGKAIAEYSDVERVAVLATGGISHDIGTPRQGIVNEEFDQKFLGLLEAGDVDSTIEYASNNVHTAGNGCEEIRMWFAALGIAAGAPYSRNYYRAVHDWYTGIGIGHFNV
jgi:hypothetical protein